MIIGCSWSNKGETLIEIKMGLIEEEGFAIKLALSSKFREVTTSKDSQSKIVCSQIIESEFSSSLKTSVLDQEKTEKEMAFLFAISLGDFSNKYKMDFPI